MASKVGRIPLSFAGGFYQSRSRQLSSQICVNWYPNYPQAKTLNSENLFPTPGLKEVVDTTDGPTRGAWLLNKIPYFVSGSALYRIDRTVNADLSETFEAVNLGAIAGSGRVRMASNKTQLVIVVPGESAYIYTEGGSLAEIVDADFYGPVNDVVQIDSFFVFCKTGSNVIFHSALNDGASYDALDRWPVYQVPEVLGLMVYRNQLYAMGDSATVPFQNIGGLQFAFAPLANAVLDSGLAGVHAKTNFRGSFIYFGGGENAENAIWLYAGGAPQKISTEPLDTILQNMTAEQVEASFALRISHNGGEFASLTIGDRCFVYDLAASGQSGVPVWHERTSRLPVGSDVAEYPWRVTSIVQAYNRVFAGDSLDGRIGQIDDMTYTEYGEQIHRTVVTQPFMSVGETVTVPAIEAYFDVGNQSDDSLALSWSDDGGNTWSNPITRSLGAVGEYGRRIVFDRTGAFTNFRVLKFEYSGENPASFNKLMANTQ